MVDVGGTISDVCGLLPSGFPRQAANFVEVGGVRMAFSMPGVLSIGLGRGSREALSKNSNAVSMVGPDSVGHELTGQALVFGGKAITATEITGGRTRGVWDADGVEEPGGVSEAAKSS